MRDDGAEIGLGQGGDHASGQQEEFASEANSDRAADAAGRGDGDFVDAKFAETLRPVEGGFAGEGDGCGFMMEGLEAKTSPEKSCGEIDGRRRVCDGDYGEQGWRDVKGGESGAGALDYGYLSVGGGMRVGEKRQERADSRLQSVLKSFGGVGAGGQGLQEQRR